MEEKYMVNDTIECTKNEISIYTDAINNSSSVEFRQILQTIRSGSESFQFELLTLATSKGYYAKTPKARSEDIEKIKSNLSI